MRSVYGEFLRCHYQRTLAVIGLLCLPLLGGCGHFWEDVTSRSPEPGVWNNVQYRWELVFQRPEPLQVLASSNDGDMRRRALESLDVNGSWWSRPEDPDLMFRVVSTSVLQERDAICRVIAVEKLSQINDPRVVQVLQEAYRSPLNDDPQLPAVKVAVLRGLGRRGDPAGLETLTEALHADHHPDLRMAAAQSLSNFKSDPAASALIQVLKNEKDVALKHRAYLSLREITGRTDLPPTAEAWEEQFRAAAAAGESPYREPNPLIKLVNFWTSP